VRVELKRLKVQLGLYFAMQIVQGFLKRTQTHRTPRAGDVGDEINFQGGHGTAFENALALFFTIVSVRTGLRGPRRKTPQKAVEKGRPYFYPYPDPRGSATHRAAKQPHAASCQFQMFQWPSLTGPIKC
jgi:hypothetical protein